MKKKTGSGARSGADPDPLVKGTDPDQYQNVMDPHHCTKLIETIST
jgi:hypothetical protein